MTVLLRCQDLDAGYEPLKVVRGLELILEAGQVTAVLGPNGAGKTTLLHTLAGLRPPLGGNLTIAGKEIARHSAEQFVRNGIVFVPDDRCLFPGLTVREHLALAGRRNGLREDEVLDYFPPLAPRIQTAAGSLSGGEQQMLAIGRALAQRPSVLLIDELSMGLAPIIVERLLDAVRHVADTGAAVLYVEQHVDLALHAADYAMVLVHGEVVLEGLAAKLLDNSQELELAYLGAVGGDTASS